MISLLYVDDEPDLLDIAKEYLENSGEFQVGISRSAQDALESLSMHSYDAIIADYHMAGMDGISLLKVVRERFGDIPFILFTGRGREEIVIEAINHGADFYLQKGGEPEAQFAELAHQIRQAVRRSQVERSLHDSERRLADIINFLPDATFAIDKEGTVIAWNRAIEEMTGISASEMLGRGEYVYGTAFYKKARPLLIDLVLSPDERFERENYLYTRRDNTTLTAEAVLEHSGTKSVHLWGTASILYDENGAIAGAIESIRDITERKAVEEALRESESKFRTIFENSPYPIAINSYPDYKFLDINKAFLEASGFAPEEVLGKDPMELGLLPIPDALKLISYRVLKGKIEDVPLALTAKEGRRIHVVFSTIPVTIDNKPAFVTVTAEITKLKRVEEDLLSKNEDLKAAYAELASADEELRHNYDELIRKEKELRTGEEKFRALVENSLDGILIADFSGTLLFVNRAAGLIVDVADYLSAIGTRNVMEFVAPESRAEVLRDFSKVAQGTDAYLVRYKLITDTKREVWVECVGKKIQFGGIPAMLVSMRDVTERIRAEERLRESENKFATVFQANPVALTLVSAIDGMFVDVNDAFVRNTGYSRDEVVGRLAEEFGIFADKEEYSHFTATLRDRRTVYDMELKCRTKAGEIRTCRFSASVIPMNGRPHILSTVEDITERKNAEDALMKSEERYRLFIEKFRGIAYLSHPNFMPIFFQGAVEEITGYSAEEIKSGHPRWDQVIHPEDMTEIIQKKDKKLLEIPGYYIQSEYRIIRKDGEVRWLSDIIQNIMDANGEVLLSGILTDVTERRRAEEALRHANRQLNLLTGITRHDILNKISVILGFLKIAEKKCEDPGIVNYLGKIESATTTIRSQIEFTRTYQDLGTRNPQWIHLDSVIPRLLFPATIALSSDVQDISIFADPMLEKVFTNLLDNSIRHGERVTGVRVFSRPSGEDRIVVWEDDGIGIAADEKERIFERGFGKNTGLGMFLSREILSLTGITIRETGVPGQGARFEITLPKGMFRLRTGTT